MTIPFFDAIIIGAGAAGLFCAGQAGQRGLKVLLIDHAEAVAEKIRISGGGRCNFTNRDLDPQAPHKHFVGQNPQSCRSAFSRYTPTNRKRDRLKGRRQPANFIARAGMKCRRSWPGQCGQPPGLIRQHQTQHTVLAAHVQAAMVRPRRQELHQVQAAWQRAGEYASRRWLGLAR